MIIDISYISTTTAYTYGYNIEVIIEWAAFIDKAIEFIWNLIIRISGVVKSYKMSSVCTSTHIRIRYEDRFRWLPNVGSKGYAVLGGGLHVVVYTALATRRTPRINCREREERMSRTVKGWRGGGVEGGWWRCWEGIAKSWKLFTRAAAKTQLNVL